MKNFAKRILCALLCMIMVLSMIPAVAATETEEVSASPVKTVYLWVSDEYRESFTEEDAGLADAPYYMTCYDTERYELAQLEMTLVEGQSEVYAATTVADTVYIDLITANGWMFVGGTMIHMIMNDMLCATMNHGQEWSDFDPTLAYDDSAAQGGDELPPNACGDNLTWDLTETGVLTISGTGDMYDYYEDKDMPWSYAQEWITEIVIEDGVTSIGDRAFCWCQNVQSVSFGNSVTNIGNFAFGENDCLTEVVLPDSLISIEGGAFMGSGIGSITFGSNLQTIEGQAFGYCSNLTSVTVPATVTEVGGGAFGDCENLMDVYVEEGNSKYCSVDGLLLDADGTLLCLPAGREGTVTIPAEVHYVQSDAFFGTDKVTNYTVADGCWFDSDGVALYLSNYLMAFPRGYAGEYTLAENTCIIYQESFNSCKKLTKVTIPNTVQEIGSWAFNHCERLRSIVFQGAAPTFYAYYGNTIFENVTATAYYPEGSPTYTEEVMQDYGGNITWKSYAEGEDPGYVDPNACGEDLTWSLSEDGVLTISGTGAMYHYYEDNDMPWGDVKEQIKHIVIEEGVTYIGNRAFCWCQWVETLEVASTVTYVGDFSFGECNALQQITFKGDAPEFGGESIFNGVAATIYYPADNATWTDAVMQNYGGNHTWLVEGTVPGCEHSYENGFCTLCGEQDPDYQLPEELPLGQTKEFFIASDETVTYTFLVEEPGYYNVKVPCWEIDEYGYKYHEHLGYDIHDTLGNYQGTVNYTFVDGVCTAAAYLEAGRYFVNFYNWYQDMEYSVSIDATPQPEKILLKRTEMQIIGLNRGSVSVEGYEPSNSYDAITWTSSNESILAITYCDGYYCEFDAVGYGTATVTATTSSGVSASCQVTVEEPKVLTEDPDDLTLYYGVGAGYVFTPEETGYYTFAIEPVSESETFECYMTDADGNDVDMHTDWEYLTRRSYAKLQAGVTYTIRYEFYNPYVGDILTCAVSAVKTPAVEKLTAESKVVEYLDEGESRYYYLSFEMDPFGSYGEVTATSSDEDVVQIISVNYENIRIKLKKHGKANVTIYLDGEKCVTVPVTVKERPAVTKLIIPDCGSIVGEVLYLYPDSEPYGSEANVTYEIADTNVAEMYGKSSIKLLKAGSTKVKATDASGVTTTFTVTARDVETIHAGWEKKITALDGNDQYVFTFTPETTGTYALIMPEDLDAYGFGYDNISVSDGQRAFIMDLEAGVEYQYAVYNGYDFPVSGTLMLKKVSKPKSVSLDKTKMTYYYDPVAASRITFNASFDKIYKWSDLTWECSDPEVLKIVQSYFDMDDRNDDVTFKVLKTGTVTVTVKTANGLSASCVVTVKKATRTKSLDVDVPGYIPTGKPVTFEYDLSSSSAVIAPYVTLSDYNMVSWSEETNDGITLIFEEEGTVSLTVLDQLTGLKKTVKLTVSNKPKAPTAKVSGVDSTGKNKVSWNKVEGAVKYQVYRATSKTGTYKLVKTTTSTSYTHTAGTAGKTYYYKVRAVAEDGTKSSYSSVVSRTCDLAQPEIKVTNVSSTGKIKVSWNKVDGAVKYQVYRATSRTGTYKLVKTTTSTSYTNTSATAGKTYYYKVKAIHEKSSANSAYSEIVSRTCDLARPNVTIKLSKGDPKLSWDKISGAKQYKIYRATSKTGTYKLIKTTTSTSYTDTSAKAGKTYYYKVVAVHTSSTANSAYSLIDYIKAK